MPKLPSDLAFHLLAALALVADVVLVVTGHPVPEVLQNLLLVGIGGAAGVSAPWSPRPPSKAADPAPAPAPYNGPVGQ
jgi:hypothetical protein